MKNYKKCQQKCKKIETSHRLCRCSSVHCKHKLWARDRNASLAIIHIGKCKLLQKNLGYYSRNIKKEEIPNIYYKRDSVD